MQRQKKRTAEAVPILLAMQLLDSNPSSCSCTLDQAADSLIEKHRDNRYQNSLHQIERRYEEEREADRTVDRSMHFSSDSNQRIHAAHELSIERKKQEGIQEDACNYHKGSSRNKTCDSTLARLIDTVDDGCRSHKCTSDQEIGKLSNAESKCSVHDKVEQDLDQLNGNARDRSERKSADEDGNLREIKLIKGGGRNQAYKRRGR